MIEPRSLVPKFHSVRLWATVAWCLVSGCFVQPAIAGYGKVPLFFVENRGQVDRDVYYMAKGPGFSAYFAHAGVSIAAGESTLRLRFPNANLDAVLEGIDPLPTRANFSSALNRLGGRIWPPSVRLPTGASIRASTCRTPGPEIT
jgi:hypothetical protein